MEAVLSTLLRAKGHSADVANPHIKFEPELALGDVWALDQIWRELVVPEEFNVKRPPVDLRVA